MLMCKTTVPINFCKDFSSVLSKLKILSITLSKSVSVVEMSLSRAEFAIKEASISALSKISPRAAQELSTYTVKDVAVDTKIPTK